MKRSASRPTNHIQHGLIKPTTCLYQTITPNKCRLISKICQCNLINIVTSMLQIIVVAFPYATQLQSIGPHCIFIYLLVTLQKDSLRFSVGSPALNWQFQAYRMYLWISQGQSSTNVWGTRGGRLGVQGAAQEEERGKRGVRRRAVMRARRRRVARWKWSPRQRDRSRRSSPRPVDRTATRAPEETCANDRRQTQLAKV